MPRLRNLTSAFSLLTLLAAFSTATVTTSASADPAPDTLARIRDTRTITLGVRETSRPFSFLDEHKQAGGYSVELCLNAVEQIRRELKMPDLKVLYKTVSGAERIPKLVAGEIDLECGSTTNTKARKAQVDFSYTIFVAGMRVLAPKGAQIQSLKDLDGLPVALSKGTTSEKLFTQLNGGEAKMQLQTFPNNDEAYQALKAGKVRAFPQDDSLLTGLAAHDNALDSYGLGALALSVEPYAIMVRKGDLGLLGVVDRSLVRMFSSGEIDGLYRKWFATDKLTIPMSRLTHDSFLRPNKEAGVAMVLGYSI